MNKSKKAKTGIKIIFTKFWGALIIGSLSLSYITMNLDYYNVTNEYFVSSETDEMIFALRTIEDQFLATSNLSKIGIHYDETNNIPLAELLNEFFYFDHSLSSRIMPNSIDRLNSYIKTQMNLDDIIVISIKNSLFFEAVSNISAIEAGIIYLNSEYIIFRKNR